MKRKIIALLLVLAFVMQPNRAFASEVIDNEVAEKTEMILQNVVEIMAESEYALGYSIPSYMVESSGIIPAETDIYPVYANDEVVAFASAFVAEIEEEQQVFVSCNAEYAEAFSDYVLNNPNEEVSLLYARDGAYIVDESNSFIKLYDWYDGSLEELNTVEVSDESIIKQLVSKARIIVPVINLSRADTNLYVTQVGNYAHPSCQIGGCNEGLCWAASIAQIVKYHKGWPYSAEAIHDMTGCHGSSEAGDFRNAVQSFGIFPSMVAFSFSKADVKRTIDAGDPSFMAINRSVASHAVVLYGYSYNSSGLTGFNFMDPNSGHTSQAFNDDGNIGLVVCHSGKIYWLDYLFSTSS